ncbi:putative endoplasmic reticulum protein [Kockovaella imperatae]|uniref:ER membrane protein complex subunit 4 n=1 Tax=Kockovaella imperatae TaxID=4999 RepID=A0A1Y1UGJ7_9TREE|nr:putative endoplasmic reticulum protein [Kockovaella imperatae]ORX36636.1 putative endoplasmic reticulum protein [Kockovaella imperatae]
MYRLDYTLNNPNKGSIPDPPGFLKARSKETVAIDAPTTDVIAKRTKKATELKMKRAWDLAIGPAKSLPMQAVMLYFSGSGIQIFSLGMIFMLLTGPIGAIFNILKTFEQFRPTPLPRKDGTIGSPSYMPLILPMLAFVGCQGLLFSLGLYKCSTMGVLPTGTGDWLQFETRNEPPEWSAARASSLG